MIQEVWQSAARMLILVRYTFAKATVDTLFAFIPAPPDGTFCEGG